MGQPQILGLVGFFLGKLIVIMRADDFGQSIVCAQRFE